MVIIIGLPFANLNSIELKERLLYADQIKNTQSSNHKSIGAAGMQLYENLCMNAVNQSIGLLKFELLL